MPGPFSMSGSSVKMDERSGENGWATERSAEFVADNGRTNGKVEVDAQLWHACAGAIVHLPQVGTKVVYFPQGHAEHAASLAEFPRSIALTSTLLCRVLSVNFLADTETDEVYARIRLQPDPNSGHDLSDDSPPPHPVPEKSASFAKTLTQSDANNGGGFSVPRYCAETIFPRLDYKEDPPVQIVRAKDVHGTVWKFRHIYRGTPRRHLLTTGWSNFVNQKKLVAGDAIVFLRSATGELCVGVRRSTRSTVGGWDASSWHLSASSVPGAPPLPSSRWKLKPPDNSFDFLGAVATGSSGRADRAIITTSDMADTANFARNRARITARDILEAASLAAAGQPFEVVYYPRATISEFCVKAHAVKAALQQNWAPGMRFKMAVETEDASRVSWFMGTISKVQEADPIGWPKSPWKMLQVTWDEPDLLHGIVRVSPWQVELVSPMQLPLFSLPKKKVRLSQSPELQLDGQGLTGLSMGAPLVASNLLGHINPWHGFADNVTARMQGARHDRSYGSTIPDFQPSNSQPSLFLESFYKHQEHHVVSGARVSTDLNMSNFGNEGHLSEHNHLSTLLTVGSSSREPALSSNGDRGGSSSSKSTPFLLFGKAIDMSQSAKSQPPELSGGSSSDGQGLETLSDGNQLEALDKMHMFLSGKGKRSIPFGQPILLPQQGEALDSAFNEVGTLKWFKERANVLDREKAITTMDNSFNHCNVFIESDEVSRTVDLSMFDSYEELHEKLSLMFGIQKTEMLSRVVCVDSMGFARPIGDEPYRDFTKRVKRLKILSESSSESITR